MLLGTTFAADAAFADGFVFQVACFAVGEHAAVTTVVTTDALKQNVIAVEGDAGAGVVEWVISPPLGVAFAAGI